MNEVTEILLNEMPLGQFIGFYLIGTVGALMFFLGNLYKGITQDISTPMKFSWKHFVKGFIRVVLALVTLAFGIIYFSDLSQHLFSLSEGQVAELNGFSALLLGIGVDGLWKKLLQAGVDGMKVTEKILKK
jgi:TRAP-type C4-dicarboxylate transport system permease large subunit